MFITLGKLLHLGGVRSARLLRWEPGLRWRPRGSWSRMVLRSFVRTPLKERRVPSTEFGVPVG